MAYLNLKPVEFSALGKKTQQAFKWGGRILLPKYDGCFAMVAIYNGHPDYIMSRTGELVKSMDHIFDDLFAMYPWLKSQKGGTMVLGEAWRPGSEFSILSGEFRRQRPQKTLGFAPFDAVSYRHDGDGGADDLPILWSAATYATRLGPLASGLPGAGLVFPPRPVACDSEAMAWAYAKHLKASGGYDGAVCSDPHATYTPGAGKGGEFIKLKPLLSFSLECIGYEAATGEKTGRDTVALVVRFMAGKPLRVATGLSHEQQANPAQFVGNIIEVEAMGVSSGGLLREPRYKGMRDDAQADY